MVGDVESEASAVMALVGETFSSGDDSISRTDMLADGRSVGQVVGDILGAVDRQEGTGVEEGVLISLRCMHATWVSGFDLAVAGDVTDGDRTLRRRVEDWAAATTGPFPAP